MDDDLARQVKLWAQKWRWYQRNALPWRRARIHWHLMRREAFARWPLHGDVLEMLDEAASRSERTRCSSPTCGSRRPRPDG